MVASTAKSNLPRMNYPYLTQDERYQIAILLEAGHDQSDIVRSMNRHKSTIGRDLRRNGGQLGYRPKQAQALSLTRARACENGPPHSGPYLGLCPGQARPVVEPEADLRLCQVQRAAWHQPRNRLSAHLCRQPRRRHPASRTALPEDP